jgi:hypothetical protein
MMSRESLHIFLVVTHKLCGVVGKGFSKSLLAAIWIRIRLAPHFLEHYTTSSLMLNDDVDDTLFRCSHFGLVYGT